MGSLKQVYDCVFNTNEKQTAVGLGRCLFDYSGEPIKVSPGLSFRATGLGVISQLLGVDG